jgi:hypothetical protein
MRNITTGSHGLPFGFFVRNRARVADDRNCCFYGLGTTRSDGKEISGQGLGRCVGMRRCELQMPLTNRELRFHTQFRPAAHSV